MPIKPAEVGVEVEGWVGVQFDLVSISPRQYLESMPLHHLSTSISFWVFFGLTSNSFRCHKDFSSVVIQLHVVIISMTSLAHFEPTRVLTPLSEFNPISLLVHFELTSNSLAV